MSSGPRLSGREPDGALVRLTVRGPAWAEGLPPVPEGQRVSVSFSSPDAAAEHSDALAMLGYRLVGLRPAAAQDGDGTADFLVIQELLDAYPAWWRALAEQADRIYSLQMGPVLSLLGAALGPHLDADG
ncbi:MAG TPA: hypothetical protein VML96_09810 [Egibacteraceae bacterium]|nr:hypothetical protein [Egibacteraceae bacterium]